jgi:iron complex outermembrane receptor protein
MEVEVKVCLSEDTGVPVLKNGVQMDSDFRTAGLMTDMQGVESIQVIKGSAAVSQGIGNGLGSAGELSTW